MGVGTGWILFPIKNQWAGEWKHLGKPNVLLQGGGKTEKNR